IIIATVANISSALVGWGWGGFGLTEGSWTMIIAATLIVVFTVFTRSNPYVGLVGVWALYGIILKHRNIELEASPQIITIAWLCLAVLALVVVFLFYKNADVRRGKSIGHHSFKVYTFDGKVRRRPIKMLPLASSLNYPHTASAFENQMGICPAPAACMQYGTIAPGRHPTYKTITVLSG
ncbi:MAG: hypothetical protein LPK14_00935, partial [Hymenobacteraceae bacterium]|nr:hypothetical protein [Hymenobacteraceae bacterium]